MVPWAYYHYIIIDRTISPRSRHSLSRSGTLTSVYGPQDTRVFASRLVKPKVFLGHGAREYQEAAGREERQQGAKQLY